MEKFASLLESELLTTETKANLTEAVKAHEAALRESIRDELEVEYAAKLEEHKNAINTEMVKMINEAVDAEFPELKADIQKALTMEADYAAKLVTEVEKIKESFNVAAIAMINESVTKEFADLREDLQESKKAFVGMKIYESFREVFHAEFGKSEAAKQVNEAVARADAAEARLNESNTKLDELVRAQTMAELLEGLEGRSRDIMKTILEGTETPRLKERYDSVLENVIQKASTEVVTETKTEASKETVITEGTREHIETNPLNSKAADELRALAGVAKAGSK